MRQQKMFFIALVFLGGVLAAYFSFLAASGLFDFFALKKSAQARILRWEVKETKGKFPLKGYYSFEADGRVFHGAARLPEPWHLNEAAAVRALQEKAKQSWLVWFDPNDPSKSALNKDFPTSLMVRAFLCDCVFVYFVVLFRRFVKNNCHPSLT